MDRTEQNNNMNELEFTVLSHVLKQHLSSSGVEAETSLAELNAEIDSMCREERTRHRKVWVLLTSVVIVTMIATCTIVLTLTSDPGVQRYANESDAAVNVGLPDGTQVWINPGTVLTFDKYFNDEDRLVNLKGEAYFDVVSDSERPFYVSASDFRVKVHGTVFNVKALEGDTFPEVSLAQGCITMQNKDGVDLVRLRPGQQAIYDCDNSTVEIHDVYVGDMLMKHYGAVSLTRATISDILKEINEVYGVQIVASSPDDKSTYNFCFQKNSDIEDVLSILRFACRSQEFTIR